jgi:hypothetical protein
LPASLDLPRRAKRRAKRRLRETRDIDEGETKKFGSSGENPFVGGRLFELKNCNVPVTVSTMTLLTEWGVSTNTPYHHRALSNEILDDF